MEFLFDWEGIGNFAQKFLLPVFGAIGAVVGGLIFLYKRWFKNWYVHYKSSRDQWRILMIHEMKKINLQLYPNGGKSMNDKVNEMFNRTWDMEAMLIDLKQGQRITREMLDMIHWESDASGNVTWVSSNLRDLLGCDESEILGTSWVGLVKSEDRTRIINSWKESVTNASMFKEVFSFIDCGGDAVKVKTSVRHTKNKDQKLINSLVKFETV